jgi:hypothetical protein
MHHIASNQHRIAATLSEQTQRDLETIIANVVDTPLERTNSGFN